MKKKFAAASIALAVVGFSAGTADAGTAPTQTIAEIVVAATEGGTPEFTTLLTAVTAADPAVLAAIDNCDDAPVTVFAPTDAAFAALPAGTLETVVADKALLTDILLYHVVPTALTASQVVAAAPTEVTAANGDKISVTMSGSDVILNGTVKVVTTDILACNGVIHVIDAVLLPPADTPEEPLPATGSETTIAMYAAVLLAAGAAITMMARRRTVTA